MKKIVFRLYALKRMYERSVSRSEVLEVVLHGITVETYPQDLPYPSKLMFKMTGTRLLNVVYAESNKVSYVRRTF